MKVLAMSLKLELCNMLGPDRTAEKSHEGVCYEIAKKLTGIHITLKLSFIFKIIF